MTAAVADIAQDFKDGKLIAYPVAATTTIYKGTMVCLNSSGYAVPAADTSGYSNVVGVAYEQVTGLAADGAVKIRVRCDCVVTFNATGITQAMLGSTMLVKYDNEFDNTSSHNIKAGVLVEFISTTNGRLLIREPADTVATVSNSDITPASLLFSSMAITDKASHGIPIGNVRGPTGLVTTATLGAGVWAEVISSNAHALGGELADANTKTSVGTFQFELPNNYVAAGDVVLRITTMLKAVTDTIGSNNGSDIDVSAYEQSKSAGTVGADICATAAQTYAAVTTAYQKDFVITATDLVAGDLLNFLITGRAIEAGAEGGTLQSIISSIEVLCDVYGALA